MEAVAALQQIGKILGKTDWNFSVDPCSGQSGWTTLRPQKGFENEVGCHCNDAVCHVTTMYVQLFLSFSQTSPKNFPPSALLLSDNTCNTGFKRPAGRTELQLQIHCSALNVRDLTRNYLSGPIPPEWGSLRLVNVTHVKPPLRAHPRRNWKHDLSKEYHTYSLLLLALSKWNRTLENNQFSGELPPHIGNLTNLVRLVISSNNFTGPLPATLARLTNMTDFLINTLRRFDVLIADSSFHIDCGSKSSTSFEGTNFEKDGGVVGAATFFVSQSEAWAMGSTGAYLDNADVSDDYTATNSSILSIPDAEVYTTARHSPLSFKYYGLCLWDGPYTVTLYFAEIMFTDDKNFSSLGKRVFDVNFHNHGRSLQKCFASYTKTIQVQDKLVLKDFNIEDAANGSGKAVTKKFSANVTNGVLRIHFFWAGKGTTVVPVRGDYGPLVSAISVDADFEPPKTIEKNSTKIIVIVVVSIGVLLFLILGSLYVFPGLKRERHRSSTFTLLQIKAATRNFHPSNKIGQGGFGPVYKGQLSDGTIVAIKQLSSKSQQGNHEFITEMGMISALQHPNLVKLHGCCIEGNELLLVYEYMENNSLAQALFVENGMKLNWPTRRKICIGIAKGLAYLHEESRLKIVHRDIKASNILLDRDLNAKISDFGLAKLDGDENAQNSIRITYHLKETGDLLKLVDPELGANFSKEEALIILNVALLCTNASPSLRPSMSLVVDMIEGKILIDPQSVCSSEKVDSTIIHFSQPRHSWTLDNSQEGP
ncbi:putative LRR receptor-like serine/threonine-protein kinase [Nymphaea thermarum]|nr:putative LRR receptor-like serine/threonine-protein kinase [Nymphaea thermarum]